MVTSPIKHNIFTVSSSTENEGTSWSTPLIEPTPYHYTCEIGREGKLVQATVLMDSGAGCNLMPLEVAD